MKSTPSLSQINDLQDSVARGDLEHAELGIRELIGAYPTFAPAYALLGLCLWKRNKPEEALVNFQRATLCDLNDVESGVMHVRCLDRLQRYEDALMVAEQWYWRFPNHKVLKSLVRGLRRIAKPQIDGWERTGFIVLHEVDLKGPEAS